MIFVAVVLFAGAVFAGLTIMFRAPPTKLSALTPYQLEEGGEPILEWEGQVFVHNQPVRVTSWSGVGTIDGQSIMIDKGRVGIVQRPVSRGNPDEPLQVLEIKWPAQAWNAFPNVWQVIQMPEGVQTIHAESLEPIDWNLIPPKAPAGSAM